MMSILLAVIGRYRSGKTALCQRFEKGGGIRLPIESMIEQLIQYHCRVVMRRFWMSLLY